MKRLLLPTLALLLVAATAARAESQIERELQVLNEQRDRAAAAAMVPINRNYQAGLQQLLKRSADAKDLEANAQIIELLRGLNTGPAMGSTMASAQTPLGAKIEALLIGSTWVHNGMYHYTFTKGGSIVLAEPHPRGKYRIDGRSGLVTMHWEAAGFGDETLQYDEKTNGFTHQKGGAFVAAGK